jgi:hypothetical protein
MRKCLFAIGFLFLSSVSWAQQTGEVHLKLEEERRSISEKFESTYSQLLIPKSILKLKAESRGIPMQIDLADGNIGYLQYFDEFEQPVYFSVFNTRAARTTTTNSLQPSGDLGVNLTGKGMVVGIYDQTRPKPDHVEYNGRLTQIDGSSETISEHSTHVSGTVLATGVNPNARGMASEATGWTFNFESDLSKMNANSYDPVSKPNGHVVSNHSYGTVVGWFRNASNQWQWAGNATIDAKKDFRFGFYSQRSKGLDDLAFSKPFYTIVWAAGNDRTDIGDGTRDPDGPEDSIGPEGVAKNIITVGAIAAFETYTGPQVVQMSSFSSWGPTDDGRIKPDLVGVGVSVFSSSIANGGTTDSYSNLSGTSMATPNVSGSLLLLQQLFAQRNNGRYMRSATVKALAINTTKEAGLNPGPDYVYGWGVLDTRAAAQIILNENGSSDLIREEVLVSGSKFEYEFVSDGVTPIRTTIAWTDPSGNPVSPSLNPPNRMLVNDLDMRLIDEQGIVHFPYVMDPARGPAGAALTNSDNFRDNVEQIFIASPKAVKYKLVVTHKGNLQNGAQQFSLVMKAGTLDGASETLYWIGPDGGAWENPSNWATTVNGPAANKIPSLNTRVVFEGGNQGQSTVNFSQKSNAFSVNLFGDRIINFDLKGNELTVSNGFRINNQITSIKNGAIFFSNPSSVNEQLVGFKQTAFENVKMYFESGNWKLLESESLDAVTIRSGTKLVIDYPFLVLNSLQVDDGSLFDAPFELLEFKKGVQIGKAQISPGINLKFSGETGEFENSSEIPVANLWTVNGELSVSGQQIGSVSAESSSIIFKSPIQVLESLLLFPGALLDLSSVQSFQVKELVSFEGVASNPVRIVGSAQNKSEFLHEVYKKYCFEFVNVSNVDLKGGTIINLGTSAEILNAAGWQKERCEDVLFANYKYQYACVGSAISFENLSEGDISEYNWDFGGQGTSKLKTPIFTFNAPGSYSVKLTVSNSSGSVTFDQLISVTDNDLPKPLIVINGNQLTSQQPGDSYQWYKNGQLLNGATQRSFVVEEDGSYQVAIFNNACNRISDPVVISSLPEPDLSRFGISVGPIPSEDFLTITMVNDFKGLVNFSLIDMAGREISKQEVMKDVQDLNYSLMLPGASGMYVLRINTNNLTLHKKVIKY